MGMLLFYLMIGMGAFGVAVGCWPYIQRRRRQRQVRAARRRMRKR